MAAATSKPKIDQFASVDDDVSAWFDVRPGNKQVARRHQREPRSGTPVELWDCHTNWPLPGKFRNVDPNFGDIKVRLSAAS